MARVNTTGVVVYSAKGFSNLRGLGVPLHFCLFYNNMSFGWLFFKCLPGEEKSHGLFTEIVIIHVLCAWMPDE